MNAYKKLGIHHKTSVEVAKTTFTTISLVDQSRAFDEAQRVRDRKPETGPLTDITNRRDFR